MPHELTKPAPKPELDMGVADPASRLKRWLRPLMLVLALGFMGRAVYELLQRWDGASVVLAPGWLVLCLAPLLVAVPGQAQAWLSLMEHLVGRRIGRGPAYLLYLDSQLARYTPGKVGLPLVRMAGAERLGLSARGVGGSILLELLSWVATGVALGSTLLMLFDTTTDGLMRLLHGGSVYVLVVSVSGLLVLVSIDRRRYPERLLGLLHLDGRGPVVPWSTPVWHLGVWAAWALHGYLAVRGVSGTEQAALVASGYFVLGPVLGFVALVAPAGVGVREAVISLGLAPLLGVAPALAAGVLSRVASVAADLCAWGICRVLGRARGWT